MTSNLMVPAQRFKTRICNVAKPSLGDRAPRVKVTAGRRIERRRDFACKDLPIARPVRIGNGDRRERGFTRDAILRH